MLYACSAWRGAGAVPERHPLNRRLDAGDGYRRQGAWVALERLADEWVVPADATAVLCANGTLQPLSGQGQLLAVHGEGRLVQRTSSPGLQRLDARSVRLGLDEVRTQDGGAQANPVYADPRTGLRLIPRGRIVVRLAPGVEPDSLPLPFEAAERLPGTQDQYVLKLAETAAEEILARVSSLDDLPQVVWAEPDFLKEWHLHRMLNDPLLAEQWHLHNTGYTLLNGPLYSPAGVDISAPDAWDRQMGREDVVIAVIDDGVQAAHPDLQANIFTNAGEVAGNGVDDDGNGYVDDVSGWDFINNTNTPEPKVAGDRHGVATAGLAAARGDNSIGVSGVAPFCKILSLKIFQGGTYVGSSALANTIRYAAGLTSPNTWRGADVLNMSFGGGEPSLIEYSAFTDAATLGRQGKGCVLVASSGNSASDYRRYSKSLSPGTYYFEWRYTKDAGFSAGDDTCRIGLVLFPDGTVERFDQPTPPAGWDFTPEAGNPGWVIENNPAKAYGLGRYQARAQPMQSNNSTALCRSRSVTFTQTNSVSFDYWISSELNYDFIEFRAVKAGEESPPAFTQVASGVSDIDPYVAYPASHPHVIAVGATTEFDYRSHFSQYGEDIDLMAPGGGGLVNIVTTDRTGTDGYNQSGDFVMTFSGTSASAPIVSGAVALLLSRHPDLTASVVRSLLCRAADKVGSVAYAGGEVGAGGRNNYYGYGRLNAGRLLWLARVSAVAGHGGLFATADNTDDLFCESGALPMLLTESDQYFTFQQWQASPASNAVIFAPTATTTDATIFDDVTLTASFSPLLAARGTPLYWLAAHGLVAPSFDAAEASDDDGDGHAAWQEWQAGTDPDDGASILRVSALERLADGRCVVQWLSVSNRIYDVLTSAAPDGTSATILASGIAPTAPLNVYTSAPLAAAAQFIRVGTGAP